MPQFIDKDPETVGGKLASQSGIKVLSSEPETVYDFPWS